MDRGCCILGQHVPLQDRNTPFLSPHGFGYLQQESVLCVVVRHRVHRSLRHTLRCAALHKLQAIECILVRPVHSEGAFYRC